MKTLILSYIFLMASAAHAEPVSLLLHYPAIGEHTAFIYGVEKGIFAEEGIDLKLIEGKGSGDTAKTMINNPTEPRFGWADAGAMVKINASENGDLVMVANYVQTSPAALATFKDYKIKTIKDLEGKKVAFAPADGSRLMWKALLRMKGFDAKDYPEVLLSPEVKLNALITGTAHAMGGLVTAQGGLIEKEAKGREVEWISFDDLGFSSLGGGLMIRGKDRNQKDLNCRMVRAATKAWTEAIKNPEEAAAIVVKLYPKAGRGSKEAILVQWKAAAARLHSKASAGMKPGKMAASDWEALVKFQKEYGDVKTRAPSDYYTNDFTECVKK